MSTHQQHGDQVIGSAIGSILVTADHLLSAVDITFGEILQTVILAAAGAAVGYLVTTLLKWLRNKIFH